MDKDNMERKQPQLVMKRDDLRRLPDFVTLPLGYSIKPCRKGDGSAWCDIINNTVGPGWNIEQFNTTFLQSPVFSKDRMFFVHAGNIPVGTATAWVKEPGEKRTGMVHYVGVLKEHAGKGLGFAVTLRTLQHMKRRGFKNAFLQTDDDRLAAIKTYLKLGFRPEIIDPNQTERWKEIFKELGMSSEK